jgi:flagella basal body P-ring formation protein FlgA
VRRGLATGEALARPAVAPPLLVEAGEPVRLVWGAGAVQVSVVGIALNRARQGESVRARVEGRSDRLVGTATATGTVVISSGGDR